MASSWGVFCFFLLCGVSRASLRGSQMTNASKSEGLPLTCDGTELLPALPSCYEGDVFGVEFLRVTFKEQGKLQIDLWGAEQGCVNADYEQDGQIVAQSNQASCDGGPPPAAEVALKYCSSSDRIVLQITSPIEHETYLNPVSCASSLASKKQSIPEKASKKASKADVLACRGTNPPVAPSCYQGDVFGIEFLNVSLIEQDKMKIYFWGVEQGCVNAEYEHEGQILKQSKQIGCDGGEPPAAVVFELKYCSSSDKILLTITQPVQHETFLTPGCSAGRRLGTDMLLL
jgi:hypothetical protein